MSTFLPDAHEVIETDRTHVLVFTHSAQERFDPSAAELVDQYILEPDHPLQQDPSRGLAGWLPHQPDHAGSCVVTMVRDPQGNWHAHALGKPSIIETNLKEPLDRILHERVLKPEADRLAHANRGTLGRFFDRLAGHHRAA